MANVAYSHVKTLSQGIQYGRTAIVTNGSPDWPTTAYFPASIEFLNTSTTASATAFSGAAQWKSNSGKVLLTAQYLRSLYKNNWQERIFGDWNLGPDLYGSMFERDRRPAEQTVAASADEFRSGCRDPRFHVRLRTVISRAARSIVTTDAGQFWWGNPGTRRWLWCERPGRSDVQCLLHLGRAPNCSWMPTAPINAMRLKSAPAAGSTRIAT